jgi:hypothetical protein
MSDVDHYNKAHSVMGPECSFCGHRLRWHDPDGCKWGCTCRCAGFDEGIPRGHWNMLWHEFRHDVEDLTTVVSDGERQRRDYHFQCSCGKEWRGKLRFKYIQDHGLNGIEKQMSDELAVDARIDQLLRDLRAPDRGRLRCWWHRHIRHHRQWQWGVEVPQGVEPIPGERIKCACGIWFRY